MPQLVKKFGMYAVAVLFFILSHPLQVALASCGAASCPIDTYSSEVTEKGMIRLDYSYEYINQDQPKIGRENAAVGEISGHHDEISTLNQIQKIGLEAGLTDRLNIQTILPFVHREHRHVHHHHGTDIYDSWNFDGMGDLTLLSKYAFIKGSEKKSRWSVIAGGVLPTGREEAINENGTEAEVGILPGKGAYSLILGGAVNKNFVAPTLNGAYATLHFFVSSTYQWNGQGKEDYKIGNTWLANVGGVYPIFPKVGLIAQGNLQISRKDDRGQTYEEINKTGGSYVYVSPGLQMTLDKNLVASIIVQIPIYQRVNEIQLTAGSHFFAGVSYRFSAI